MARKLVINCVNENEALTKTFDLRMRLSELLEGPRVRWGGGGRRSGRVPELSCREIERVFLL